MTSPFRRHRVDLTASLGYSFIRAFFELDIEGEDLAPDEVTTCIGIDPTSSHKKGDEHPKRQLIYSTGAWTHSSGEIRLDPSYGEEELHQWLLSIPADAETFRELSRRYSVILRIVLYAQAYNSEFYISPETLQLLASRGLRLMIDTYLCHDVIPEEE